jgi:HK97 family phage portal protein
MASIFERFQNAITKSSQKTNEAFNKLVYNHLGNNLITSVEGDDTYINKGYRFNSTIYSIVNLITKAASTVPFQIYEVKNNNDLKRYKAFTSGTVDQGSMFNSRILQKKAFVEIQDTELHELLARPNPAQSYNAWIQEIIAFGQLTGNRYIYGIAPNSGDLAGKFGELYVLPSQAMEIHSGGLMQPVKEYTLEYNGTHRVDAEQICHIKNFNPYHDGTGSHLYGMSPLRAGLRSMDANNEALTTGVKYLQNQTARGMLIADEGDITEAQAKALKGKFRQTYQGSNNAGDVIITPKKLSWVNFGLNASDLSLIEQYNASIKDLCNIYNVPVQLLNNTDSTTYNNMKEAKKALYQNAVIPELVKIREELNRWLTPRFGDKLYIDFDFSVIPELQEETDKIVDQMSKSWWLTPNEKRTAMSYAVNEDDSKLNDYYIPANLIPMNVNDMGEDLSKQLHEAQAEHKSQVLGLRDVYTTIREARERSVEMGAKEEGYHEHLFEGNTVYMPFKSHEEYEAAVENRLSEYYANQEQEVETSGLYDQEYSADDEMMQKKPKISGSTETALRNKVKDHNEEHGDDPAKRATYGMLAESFRRGVGAFRTNPSSVRPSVSSEDQWGMARVNGLLHALRTGKYKRKPYDTDLLPDAHPLSSKKDKSETYSNYPQGATNNAKRVLDWDKKHDLREKMGTSKGWARAEQLAARRSLSQADVNSIYSFLKRHEQNAEIAEEFRGTPYKDKGYVMYNAWGGRAMLSYVERNRSANQDE